MSLEFNNFLDTYNISYESLSAVHDEEFTEDNAYQILLNDESIQSLKDAVKEEADYNIIETSDGFEVESTLIQNDIVEGETEDDAFFAFLNYVQCTYGDILLDTIYDTLL